MKTFEYAQTKNTKKSFKMPSIKFDKYNIPLWALPIAPFVIACDKFNDWNYRRQEWSEEKATKALNYFLPHVLEFVEEDNAYYYCTNWHYDGWNIAKKVPFGMKKWAKKFGYETLKYLEEGYENAEFSKSIEKDYCDTWIKFEKKA